MLVEQNDVKNNINRKVRSLGYFIGFFVLTMMNSIAANAQLKQTALQGLLDSAIKKAYKASVRIWGFDIEKNERTTAQFSGVVVSEKGIVLTAAHTIWPGTTYKVFFPDGRETIAKALGRIDLLAAPGTPDAGMMQILDKQKFPFAEMGFSTSLRENESCISISYPEKINQTLPTIRLGKIAEVKNEYGFLRSTCKMEPGDSGGPLFDQWGKVIGIHSAIDVAEDMNFEIPIDVYRKYWTALHEEVNYTKYPSQEDNFKQEVGTPTHKTNAIETSISKLAGKFAKGRHGSCTLTSKIAGIDNEVVGTIINLTISKAKSQIIIGKNSMVGDSPNVLINGLKMPLVVVKRDKQNDLIFLKADKDISGGIDIDTIQKNEAQLGTVVMAILPNGKYQKGIVGNKSIILEKNSSSPYLGVSVLFKSSPATVTVVKPGSPAALAGIQAGDFIVAINHAPIRQANEFLPELGKYWAGDEITIDWLRGDQTFSKSIKLINKPFVASKHPVDRFIGGSSERRDGFKEVFTHDVVLLPNQCGGPLFSIDGKFLGINIARYSRAVSLAVPRNFIVRLLKGEVALNNRNRYP